MLKVGPRYGWVIVASLTLLLAATHGLITGGMSVFDKSILVDLGIGRGALKFRDFLQMIAGGLFSIAIGYVAARTGPRAIIYAGLALLTAVLMLYSHVTSVAQIYPLHVAFAFCYASCHVVIVVLIITRWFATRKSIALGVILAGESLGGTIFPQIVVRLIAHFGWREAMQMLAILPVGLAVLMLLTLRDAPEKFGIGRIGTLAAAPHALPTSDETFVEQLTRPATLLLLGIAGMLFLVGGTFAAHAFLAFLGRGLTAQGAASGLSLWFIAAFAGKFLSGFIAERIGLRRMWILGQLALLAGALGFTWGDGGVLWTGTMLLGFGWGCCYTLTQGLIMDQFAGPWLGRLSGIAVMIEGSVSGLGIWLAGVMFDHTHSYDLPFSILAGAAVLAIVASISLQRSTTLNLRPATA